MKKILVIEDETAVRDVILDILDAEDFYAIGAENGRIGVQLAQESSPDLVICDMMMPELDGQAVLSELRKDPTTATMPFIFLTAKADKTDRRQGMESGADDYLTKPFTRTELLRAISSQLEKQTAFEQKLQTKLNDLRGSISLSLPHELNTPLNNIINSSKLLLDEVSIMDPGEVMEVLEVLYGSSLRLSKVVQNFLLYAQLELAAADPQRVKILRSSSTEIAKELIGAIATQKAQQVDREADLQLSLKEATIQISDAKLKKIVEELVDNAFKFSLPGTPVRILSTVTEQSFSLYVIDYGRGMTEAQIADLGAYMQFDRKLYEQQGSGLGLVIAKRLTELHQGELFIESFPGRQTTVRVVLPIVMTA